MKLNVMCTPVATTKSCTGIVHDIVINELSNDSMSDVNGLRRPLLKFGDEAHEGGFIFLGKVSGNAVMVSALKDFKGLIL